jgi:hypothetical protein
MDKIRDLSYGKRDLSMHCCDQVVYVCIYLLCMYAYIRPLPNISGCVCMHIFVVYVCIY